MGCILRKDFDLMETNLFCHNSKTGQILPKTVFLLKMSYLQKTNLYGVMKHLQRKLIKIFSLRYKK